MGVSESPDGVAYRLDAGVATIELRRSALDAPLRGELLGTVSQLRDGGVAVRAVLLTARGKHFCVGQDLKEHARALENGAAAEGARFATAFTGIGLAADSGLSGALAQAVGPSRAAALMLLGDRFGAEEALRWGLVHRVVPDGDAAAEGLALARRLAAGPTVAYAEVKALLRDAPGASLATVLEREAAAQERLGATRDHRAAVEAFLARAEPSFEGR
ncbi:enoyl-CoA hydratase/isomerase family protein [Streptomyces xylophagus]|uniref:enoyl-CoA hydratase/isomerase family protein n=1 Tax=Streptomyces xylophagus TaxID=285514 RepID=UPI00068FA9AF|nr:enoyl-CoA hydratase-related protein [Streptomyces xylophagus]